MTKGLVTTMPRLIDADALASVLEEWEEKACDGTENDGSDGTTRVLHPVPTTTAEMIDLIAAQATIVAEPVKHGRWVPVKLTRRTTEYKCSICGRWERTNKEPYCNCGAKMDGGIDRDNEM